MEKGERSMEVIKAEVKNKDDKYYIRIDSGDNGIIIPLSEDKPNDVKDAFNKIITRMKDGEFLIELENIGDDLFSQVANEYIIQLNREIKEVRGEMKEYDLVKDIV